jgi:hypothetical protein
MASNINADAIDSNYPIAGTNNSTQGFRDNFANIKNNLNYAKSELSDLQSKAILKSALSGQTLNNDFSETVISNVTLKSPGTVISDLGATSGSAVLDFGISTHYLISTTGSVSISFTDWPTAGICGSIRLVIKINSIDHTLTIPGSVSMGLPNIAGLSSVTTYGLSIKPPTKIVSTTTTTTTTTTAAPTTTTTTTAAPGGTTTTAAPTTTTTTTTTTAAPSTFRYYTVDQSQTVGSLAIPVQFTGTTTTGTTAVFLGFINDTILTVTSVISGTIVADMTLTDNGVIGSSTITFALIGDYVFDFETIDHGTSILIMDQSRASNVENVSYTPYALRPATTSRLGGFKIGLFSTQPAFNITADGTLTPRIASSLVPGVVKIGSGLVVAPDGTLSTSASSGSSGTLSNDSIVFGILSISKPNYGVYGSAQGDPGPLETTWTNWGVSIRIPAAGSYRFRVLGALFYYISAQGGAVAGMLRIYVNGTNSSAADITFTVPNLSVLGSGNTDVYRDITGLQRGDKIELYFKWATNPNTNASNIGQATFTVLIAGENCSGIHALLDYSLSTTAYPGIISPTSGLVSNFVAQDYNPGGNPGP